MRNGKREAGQTAWSLDRPPRAPYRRPVKIDCRSVSAADGVEGLSASDGERPDSRRRVQPAHVRRRQILDATAKLLEAGGYEALTIDRVASEAGIAKGTVYLYFKGKLGLLVALQEDVARSFLDGPLQLMEDQTCSWLQRLQALVRRRLEVRLSHSKLYHELFHVRGVPDGEEPLKHVRELMAEILERGTLAGEFDVQNVNVTTDFLMHAAGGACDHVDRSDPQEVLQTIAQVQELFRRVVRAAS